MTYNVEISGHPPAATLDAIAAAGADLVLLQETTHGWERPLRRLGYPHATFHTWPRATGGLAVLSKHAILEDRLLPPTVAGSWFPAQRTVVDAPGGPLQVLHVHLRPMIEGGDPVRGFFSTPPIRRAEIEAYWTEVTADPPRVVAGDFNEEPGGQALAFLAAQGLRRVDAGGPTWEYRGSWRGNDVHLRLALDHVVLDARLAARDAAVLDAGASDHKPVVMTIDQ